MADNRQNPAVVVIGAGLTGIMLVIKLREAGITDITLLEKRDSVGGTWRENTYPGVACDVPAHAYTYSFAANPEWSSMFAPGREIRAYFEEVFREHGVDRCTRFNEEVTSCRYEGGRWTVSTRSGQHYHADLLFAATGMLHQPVTPAFPGLEDFRGARFHSAQWDHEVELKGRRIGVIGTGSSAAQLIPELVDMPGTRVTVFQRTPQWIVNLDNRRYSERDRQRFRDKPGRMARIKRLSLGLFAQGTAALTGDRLRHRAAHALMAWNAQRYLRRAVPDEALRRQLTPDYKLGCKRVVLNSTFYPAIQKPNAQLVTEGIDHFEAGGIRTADGVLHELDVVVCATGFDPLAYMRPMEFVGRGGVDIERAWRDRVQAYRSLCLPHFPNFFLMLGPNSPIGNYSVIAIAEVQADYALQLIRHWREGRLPAIEARPEAQHDWNAMLREKMGHTIWASGCSSWYLDAQGDPITWPGTWSQWMQQMHSPQLQDFVGAAPEPEGERSEPLSGLAS